MADEVEETVVPASHAALTLAEHNPAAAEQQKRFHVERAQLREKEDFLTQAEGELAARREGELAPARSAVERGLSRPVPEMGQLEQAPSPPPGPLIDPQQFHEFGKIAFPFIMLLGKTMRADGVQALNALSHSVQGYMQGREKESKHQFDQFKAKMDGVVANNRTKVEEYRSLLNRRDLDNQQKLQLLEIAAHKYDDAAMYYASQRKNLAEMHKHIDQEEKNTLKIAEMTARTAEAAERTKNQHQDRQAADQTRRSISSNQIASRERIADRKAAQSSARASDKASAKERAGQHELNASIRDIDNLVDKITANPNIVGPRGWVTGFVESVKGLTGQMVPGDSPQHQFEAAIKIIQAHMAKGLYGRVSNYELKSIQDTISGMKWDDSAEITKAKLTEVRNMLERRLNSNMEQQSENVPYFESVQDATKARDAGKIRSGDWIETPEGRKMVQ